MVKQINDNLDISELRNKLSSLTIHQKNELKQVEVLIKKAYPFNEVPEKVIELYLDLLEANKVFKSITETFFSEIK